MHFFLRSQHRISNACKRTRRPLHLFLTMLVALMAVVVRPAAAAPSTGCDAVNAGTLGYSETGSPSSLSGTYSVSPSGAVWDNNWSAGGVQFAVGDVISYTMTVSGQPSPYLSISVYGTGFAYLPSSVSNVTSSTSGTITITDPDTTLVLAATDYPIDALGSSLGSETGRRGTSGQITVSCTPVATSTAPTLTNVSPTTGTTAGGTSVTLTGTNFDTTPANNTVKFGTANATVTAASATSLTVTTPAGSAGTVDVSVIVGSDTATLVNAYAYAVQTPTISLATSHANPSVGTTVTLTATLAGGSSPSGTVTFKDGATTIGTGTISGTTATLSTAALTLGSHALTAVYDGDTHNNTATSSSVTVNVSQASPTVSLAASNSTPAPGDPVTFTATLAGGSSPSGTVTFKDGSTTLGTTTISGSAATYITSTLGNGSHTITAVYGGDTNNSSATSSAITVTVTVPAPTLTGVSPALGTTSGGTAITLTGTNFSNATDVTIAGTTASFTIVSATTITATTTAHAAGAVDVAVTTPGGIATAAGAYTYVAPAPPVAGAVSLTVDANSSNNAVTLNLSGGAATAVTVATPATHGTATASGTSITYTPTAGYAGSDSFSYTATNDDGTSAAAAVTITVTPPTVSITPVSLTAATVGAAYSQTVTATGGTSPYDYSISSGSLPAGLVLSAGGTISGTPTAGGTFTFTVGATDMTTGLGPVTGSRTYTLTVNAPTIAVSPASVPGGSVNSAYSQSFTASAGTAPYTYAITITSGSLPAGLAFHASTGVLSGTPTASGTVGFTVTATDSSSGSGPYAGSRSYTLTVDQSAPVVGAVSATVAANSSGNPITLDLSGGAADSVAIDAAATHGTASVSGTSVTYTPTAGYSGTDSFTYTAPNAVGTSSPATVTVTITAPALALSPAAGALTDATAGTAYSDINFLASNGTAPYTYAVTSGALPSGMSLSSGGVLSGTPAAATAASFTITATDSYGATGSAAYTLAVAAAPVSAPVAGPVTATVTANSSNNAITLALTGDAADTVAVATPAAHGSATASGTSITYTPTPGYSGTDSFTYTATNTGGTSSPATVTITVTSAATTFTFSPAGGALTDAMIGEDYSQTVTATGGTAPLIYSLASGTLPDGMTLNISTGELTGPLDPDAEDRDYAFTIEVRDANGSTGSASYTLTVTPRSVTVTDKTVTVPPGSSPADVYLNRGATGGPFTEAETTFMEPANAGTATIIRGQVASAGPSVPAVGWYLQFTPNPAYSGTVRVGFRLTSSLGSSNVGTVTYSLSADPTEVRTEIDQMVQGFVKTRQDLISSSIVVPGLLERRRMSESVDPVTARMMPSEQGMAASFSTSLAQISSAADGADGVPGSYTSPFNIWIDGTILAQKDASEDGGRWGSFAMLNAGADYLINDKALVGLSFHYDQMIDPTDEDATLTGKGWLAGPYASFEIGRGVFWNTSLLYGGSTNDIDTAFWDGTFDTTRWMADSSIEGQWQIGDELMLSPKLRVVYFNETVADYNVKDDSGDTIAMDGFDEEQFRVSLGAEIGRSFLLENGTKLTPKLGLTGGFSGLDGSGAFGSIRAGFSLQSADLWMLDASLLFGMEGDGGTAVGGRVRASKSF